MRMCWMWSKQIAEECARYNGIVRTLSSDVHTKYASCTLKHLKTWAKCVCVFVCVGMFVSFGYNAGSWQNSCV